MPGVSQECQAAAEDAAQDLGHHDGQNDAESDFQAIITGQDLVMIFDEMLPATFYVDILLHAIISLCRFYSILVGASSSPCPLQPVS